MALTSDKELFSLFENADIEDHIDDVIVSSLQIKRHVVEQDETEKGLRKILNFGHTIGHGIESGGQLKELYHGECVALGMLPMCGEAVRQRLVRVLQKVGLPTHVQADTDSVISAINHDKKCDGDTVTVVMVNTVGEWEMQTLTKTQLAAVVKEVFG